MSVVFTAVSTEHSGGAHEFTGDATWKMTDRPRRRKRLSPEALAAELADLQKAQAELTRTIDRLAGQIDSLQTADPPQGLLLTSGVRVTGQADPRRRGCIPPAATPRLCRPSGIAIRLGSPTSSTDRGQASFVVPSPTDRDEATLPRLRRPVDSDTKRSPLDRLLGEDFGKPRVHRVNRARVAANQTQLRGQRCPSEGAGRPLLVPSRSSTFPPFSENPNRRFQPKRRLRPVREVSAPSPAHPTPNPAPRVLLQHHVGPAQGR